MEVADLNLTLNLAPSRSAVPRRDAASPIPTDQDRSAVLLGIALCAIFPALFWCTAIWYAGHALGSPPNPVTMVMLGVSIAAFLTVIASSVMSSR